MSLINDALKQTKQAQPQNPPSTPPPLPPIEPVSQENINWLPPIVIVLLFAAAGIFVGLWLSKHVPPPARVRLAAATVTQQVESVTVTPPVVTNPPTGSNTVTVVAPKPPAPKLQGILFTAARPCAIVSGQTVFVGDHVGKFRVAAILRGSVMLQSTTETNVLSLSPQ